MGRAEQWVNAQLTYCQSPNHQRDYDPSCSSVCKRTDNAAWDPYRSDCSGLVSWAWGLPAPGARPPGFAPFVTDITPVIAASDLQPGDAVNNSDHVMLFKAWVTPGQVATFIEEPGCSAATPYAHEFTSGVTISGSSIYVAYNGMTFTAIRYGGITIGAVRHRRVAYPYAAMAPDATGHGYWIAGDDGGVFTVRRRGLPRLDGRRAPQRPDRRHGRHPGRPGYWLVARRRRHLHLRRRAVLRLGAAPSRLNKPIVGHGRHARRGGYWLVASDGGVFSFGDAALPRLDGRQAAQHSPIVGMAATPDGGGYWLVASDGGIFAFGDAALLRLDGRHAAQHARRRHGRHARRRRLLAGGLRRRHLHLRRRRASTARRAACRSTSPIVGMAATPDGGGYWLVAGDGGVFTFGDAAFAGSRG